MISSLIESLLESIDKVLSEGRISWGAIITALLFFNKINKYKEFRARDKRVEQRQMRIESKIDDLMLDKGVVSSWSITEIGSKNTVQKNSKKWLRLLPKVIIRRRKKIMTFLKSSISKKLFTILLGVAVTALNKKFNLNLSENDIYIMFVGIITYIVGQSHVDAKKAIANTVKAISVGVQAAVPNIEPMPDIKYSDLIPTIKNVHNGINNLLKDAKLNDGSQAFKDASQAYFAIIDIIESFKQPEPLPTVQDEQDEQVSA